MACATVGMPIAAAASPAATAHPRTPPHDPPSVAVLSPARIDLGGAGGRSSSAEAPARARILGPRTRELLTVMDIPPTIGAGLEGADAQGPTRRIRAGAVDAMGEEAVHAIAAISRIYSAVLCTVERAASGARGLTTATRTAAGTEGTIGATTWRARSVWRGWSRRLGADPWRRRRPTRRRRRHPRRRRPAVARPARPMTHRRSLPWRASGSSLRGISRRRAPRRRTPPWRWCCTA